MSVKVTYNQINDFRANGRSYIQHIGSKQNPLSYAIQKMLKKTEKHADDYAAEAQDFRAEATLVKDGVFVSKTVHTANGPVNETEIDPSKLKALNDKMRKLGRTEVEIEPHIATALPKDLEQIWVEHFIPFVIEDFIEPSEKDQK